MIGIPLSNSFPHVEYASPPKQESHKRPGTVSSRVLRAKGRYKNGMFILKGNGCNAATACLAR